MVHNCLKYFFFDNTFASESKERNIRFKQFKQCYSKAADEAN